MVSDARDKMITIQVTALNQSITQLIYLLSYLGRKFTNLLINLLFILQKGLPTNLANK